MKLGLLTKRNIYITACAHAVSTSKWENRLAQKIWIVAAGLNIKSLKQQEWEYVHTSRESSISHSVANMQSTWGPVCSRWSQIICPYYNRHHTTTKTLEISKRSWYSYDLSINNQGKGENFPTEIQQNSQTFTKCQFADHKQLIQTLLSILGNA